MLPVKRPRMMLADKGYDGDDVRGFLRLKSILPVIPPKANRKTPVACDFRAYRDRNCIERMCNYPNSPAASPRATTGPSSAS